MQDGFRLRETLHLLVEGRLARVEVVEREVARLVQISLLVLILLLLVQRGRMVLLRGGLVDLLLGLLFALVRDVAGLLLDRRVRVLHEGLVGLLSIGFSLDGVGFHCLRLRDDLLKHTHDTAGPGGLVVEALELRERGLEELLRLTLVRDDVLEVLVLELAVLPRALELHLHLRDLCLEGCDSLRELLDLGRQLSDPCGQLLDVTRFHLDRDFVLVQRLDAEVLHLDVSVLLFLEIRDHSVDVLRNLLEPVELNASRKLGNLRFPGLLGRLEEDLLRLFTRGALLRALLDEVERRRESVVGVVGAEDRQSLADSFDFLRASLCALLELLIGILARLLQVYQELLVSRKAVARVLQILLRLRILRIRVGELLSLRVFLVRAGLDLLVRRLALHLLLLRILQVRLEGLLHLLQDAEDRPRLRRIALFEGRLRIKVVRRGLDESRDLLALARRGNLLDEALVAAHLVLDHDGDVDQRSLVHL